MSTHFSENDHPRNPVGKFVPKGGSQRLAPAKLINVSQMSQQEQREVSKEILESNRRTHADLITRVGRKNYERNGWA